MNKIQKTIDTQDAQFDEKFGVNESLGCDTDKTWFSYTGKERDGSDMKHHIQSSRTALIEEVIEMGEEMKKTSKPFHGSECTCNACVNDWEVLNCEYNSGIDKILAPLKEVIDKEQ